MVVFAEKKKNRTVRRPSHSSLSYMRLFVIDFSGLSDFLIEAKALESFAFKGLFREGAE